MTKPLFVVWGVPGAGKSTFARWLSDTKGFTHIETDVERPNTVDNAWRRTLLRQITTEAFMGVAAEYDHPVVLEYGLYAVQEAITWLLRMQRLGADPWWFDGDRPAAFAAWRAENVLKGRNFTDQKWHDVVSIIDTNWQLIEQFFGQERIIRTIEAGLAHLPPEMIYKAMQRSAA
jgi:hypothetical protein